MMAGLSIIKCVLTPLAKSVLVPLGLRAAASAKDAAIQKKNFSLGMNFIRLSNACNVNIFKWKLKWHHANS